MRQFHIILIYHSISECGVYLLMSEYIEPLQNVTPYVRSFLAGGLYKLLVDWIKNDCSIPVEKLADFLSIGGDTLLQTYTQ